MKELEARLEAVLIGGRGRGRPIIGGAWRIDRFNLCNRRIAIESI